MKNDFNFIKEKFDADGISAPDNISENNMLDKLSDKTKVKIYKKTGFKTAISAVACFALIIGILAYAAPKQEEELPVDLQNNSVVTSFESYSDIKKAIDKFNKEQYDYGTDISSPEKAIEDTAEDTALVSDININQSYAETYVQVDGVDEADKIKNDGKYIYFVNDENEILIYESEKLITTITDFKQRNDDQINNHEIDDSYEYKYIADIYVKSDKLIVNETIDKYQNEKYIYMTNSYIYDISDIANPKQIKKFTQSGSYSTSRLINNILYVVSNKNMYECKTKEDCYIITGENENETTLPATSIKCGESINDTNYLIVSAVNLDTQERTADTKAFLGCGSRIYCNKNNMYIAINGEETEIVKAALTENEIKFTATAKVKGYVNNQFSMDERNGYFRIATIDEIGNNLYIFDSQLNKISEITGFAENEEIQAVKYIGDMAYVITYEFTDPLFVIDLSDPHNPEMKGSVEITGFSSQLVSVDENTLLGIGYDDSDGIKFALFDISNPSSPTVLDSYSLLEANSNAQYNHKAIVVNKTKGYFAIDYSQYTDSDYATGGIVFEIKNNKINIINNHLINSSDYDNAERVTYIDDTIYILASSGNIYSFNQ